MNQWEANLLGCSRQFQASEGRVHRNLMVPFALCFMVVVLFISVPGLGVSATEANQPLEVIVSLALVATVTLALAELLILSGSTMGRSG